MSNTAEIYKFPDRGEAKPRGPQVEDGFTRIAKPILKNLGRARLRATEYPVVLFVIEETYGWQDKTKRMTASYIAEGLGMPEKTVAAVVPELVRRKILYREGDSHGEIGLNKYADEWLPKHEKSGKPLPPKKPLLSKENPDEFSKENPYTNKDIRILPNNNQQTAREFQMTFEWKPSDNLETNLRMKNPSLLGYLNDDLLTGFVGYWSTRPDRLTQNQWEGKLINALIETKRRLGSRAVNSTPDDGKQVSPCPHESILQAWESRLATLKGKAPAPVDWMGTSYARDLERLWRKYWGGKNPSGKVRYDDVSTGVAWFDMVFADLATSKNFANSDVTIFKLFRENVFTAAINRQLESGKGAVR